MALPSKACFPHNDLCLSLALPILSSWLGAHMVRTTSSCCPHVPGTMSRTWALSSDIHSFSKYLWSASYMRGTFPGTNKYLCPCGGAILVEDTDKLTMK